MIFVIINSKGGVGKSTFANQILPAFFYEKNSGKKVKIIEIDDENEDCKILNGSDIIDARVIHTSKIREIDEIFIDDEDVILDVGGNKTATIFLDEMRKNGEANSATWFIPAGAGVQDTANALDTYNEIKKLNANAKIIFVLSNSKNNDLAWEFLHFFGNEFLNTPFAISKHINNYNFVVVPFGDIVNNAKTFGKTIYDIAINDSEFKELAKQAKLDGKEDLKRKYLFLNRVKNEAIEYIQNLKNGCFKELDILLKSEEK